MSKDQIASVVGVTPGGVPGTTNPSIVSFAVDPVATGVAAPIASLGIRTDSPSFYAKTGTANTAWSPIGFSSGALTTLTLTSFSPAQISGTVNDYSPTGIAANTVMRQPVASTGATLTGLNALSQQVNGAILVLENSGPGPLVLAHDSGSSTTNRFWLPNDMNWTVPNDGSALCIYDIAIGRWRVLVLGTPLATAISADAITGTHNDYAPTVGGMSVNLNSRIRQALSGSATITGLTGLSAPPNGFVTALFNIDPSSAIMLTNDDPGSSAANQITLPGGGPATLPPNAAASLVYDAVDSKWRPVALPVNSATSPGATVPWFGDGSDGVVTCNGTTVPPGMSLNGNIYTLQRDVFASSMSVNTGKTVVTNSYRLFVKGTLTMSGTASINNDGGNAGSPSAHFSGRGANPSGFYGDGGGNGGSGAINGPGSGFVGSAVTPNAWIPLWTANVAQVTGTTGPGGNGGGHGQGGAGGGDGTNTGGSSAPGNTTAGVNTGGFTWIAATNGRSDNQSGIAYAYGQGGGGGAATASVDEGGGGGGGAGLCYVAAKVLAGSGSITANGGKGADGSQGSGGSGAGGGGGGGGGVVVLFCTSVPSTITTSALGGTHGQGKGGGKNGGDGSGGTVVIYNLG